MLGSRQGSTHVIRPSQNGLVVEAFFFRRPASARTFKARWPPWLEKRVDQLFAEHPDVSVVWNTLLFENDTYVTLRTLKSKLAWIAN